MYILYGGVYIVSMVLGKTVLYGIIALSGYCMYNKFVLLLFIVWHSHLDLRSDLGSPSVGAK